MLLQTMRLKYMAVAYLPALLWTAVVFALLLGDWSSTPSVVVIPHLDKIVHAFLFFILVLTYLWLIIYKKIKDRRLRLSPLWAIGCAIGMAFLTETIQEYLLTYRHGDIWDFTADIGGICLASLVFPFFGFPKRQNKSFLSFVARL